MYDDVTFVSLGSNCEPSFRIEDFTQKPIDSYPFSWCAILDTDKFIEQLKNIDDMLSGKLVYNHNAHMVKDEKYQINYHLKGKKEEYYNEDTRQTNFKRLIEGINELKSRSAHMVQKWKYLLNNGGGCIFVVRSLRYSLTSIKALYEFLNENYKSGKFILLVVQDKANVINGLDELDCPKLVLGTIEVFADAEHGIKNSGDKDGWLRELAKAYDAFKNKYQLL